MLRNEWATKLLSRICEICEHFRNFGFFQHFCNFAKNPPNSKIFKNNGIYVLTDLSIYGLCAENPGPFRPDIRAEVL